MARIALLLLSLTLFGCSQPAYLTKPGLDEETFRRDSQACAAYLGQEARFQECMGTRGYTTARSVVPRFKMEYTY